MKNHLRVLRAARKWSQGDLAERLGVSRQTVNALEVEKYDPSLPLAFKLSRLFGVPIEAIFEDDTRTETVATEPDPPTPYPTYVKPSDLETHDKG